MNPFVCGHLVIEDSSAPGPLSRWMCSLGVLHAVVVAVGLTLNFL